MTTPIIYPRHSMPVAPDEATVQALARAGGWHPQVRTMTLPLPTLADVLAYYAALSETDPEDRAIITPYGDPAHQRQRAARQREVRRGQTICAVLLIALLVYVALWIGPHWLLP